MTAIAFDTLKFARTLREKGAFPAEQAEGLAEAIAEAVQGDIATKGDVDGLRSDIAALRVAARADTEALRLATKADLAELKADLLRWVAGLIGLQTLAIIGAVVALVKSLH